MRLDDHLPVDHKLSQMYRFGAGLMGLILVVFGILGLLNGVSFLSKAGDRIAGLNSNGALSTISIVIGVLLREKAKRDPRPRNAGLLALKWDYTIEGEHREPIAEEILQEINGYTVANHELVPGFTALKADGSTACGCWIYSGVFPKMGENRANERAAKGFYGHGWGFAWPSDRRVLFNRASARPDGNPWSERKKLRATGSTPTSSMPASPTILSC